MKNQGRSGQWKQTTFFFTPQLDDKMHIAVHIILQSIFYCIFFMKPSVAVHQWQGNYINEGGGSCVLQWFSSTSVPENSGPVLTHCTCIVLHAFCNAHFPKNYFSPLSVLFFVRVRRFITKMYMLVKCTGCVNRDPGLGDFLFQELFLLEISNAGCVNLFKKS